jgi:hypothetical protein
MHGEKSWNVAKRHKQLANAKEANWVNHWKNDGISGGDPKAQQPDIQSGRLRMAQQLFGWGDISKILSLMVIRYKRPANCIKGV